MRVVRHSFHPLMSKKIFRIAQGIVKKKRRWKVATTPLVRYRGEEETLEESRESQINKKLKGNQFPLSKLT